MRKEQPRSGVSRLLGAIVNLVLVAATLLAVAFLTPSLLGFERYVITGGSMSGTIEKGSVVFERAVPVDELAVGDVITYLPPADSGVATLVTHRIVSLTVGETGQIVLRTQGDANAAPDPWEFSLVSADQPVVEHVVPHVGHALIALADPDIRQFVIGVPAGMVALIALGQLVAALRPQPKDVPNRGGSVELVGAAGGAASTSVDHDENASRPQVNPPRVRHLVATHHP